MTVGKGTKAGKELRGIVDEIEACRERKKTVAEQEKEIFQRAKAKGFDTKTLRAVLTIRKNGGVAKWQEAESLLDTYMHAIGMAEEPPLFVAMSRVSVDLARRDEAIEFLKSIVPATGEIVLKLGGLPIRVFRDADGDAHAEEVVEIAPSVRDTPSMGGMDRFPTESPDDREKAAVRSAADRAEAAAARKRVGDEVAG